jgi:hypothetical protein
MQRLSRVRRPAVLAYDGTFRYSAAFQHGIVYDILAYEGSTPQQKRAELPRVVEAMSHRPGDETLVRKFPTPHPDLDPRVYDASRRADHAARGHLGRSRRGHRTRAR